MTIQFLCSLTELFVLLLSCMSYLYILDITPYQVCHSQIFSLLYMLPVHLVIVSFAAEKFFSLMSSHLLIFVFVALAFGVISKKSLPRLRVKWTPLAASHTSGEARGQLHAFPLPCHWRNHILRRPL